MSSRLFREIREERGLAYAVYSFRMPYADSGAYGIYVGTTPRQTAQVLELIRAGLAGLSAAGVTADELERAKGNMKGSLALSMEETNSRMIRLGRHELTGVRHLSLDETVAAIDAVTRADVHEVAEEVFSSPRVLGAVGPFAGLPTWRRSCDDPGGGLRGGRAHGPAGGGGGRRRPRPGAGGRLRPERGGPEQVAGITVVRRPRGGRRRRGGRRVHQPVGGPGQPGAVAAPGPPRGGGHLGLRRRPPGRAAPEVGERRRPTAWSCPTSPSARC